MPTKIPYYDKVTVLSKDKDEADAFNHVFSDNSFFKADLKAGTKTVWQQATNQDLFAKIHMLFSSLDPSDDEALNQSVSDISPFIETVFATLNGTQGHIPDPAFLQTI